MSSGDVVMSDSGWRGLGVGVLFGSETGVLMSQRIRSLVGHNVIVTDPAMFKLLRDYGIPYVIYPGTDVALPTS